MFCKSIDIIITHSWTRFSFLFFCSCMPLCVSWADFDCFQLQQTTLHTFTQLIYNLQFTTPHTFTQPIYKFRFSFWKVTFLAVYASSYAEAETKRALHITCNINSRTQDQTFSLCLFLLNLSGIKVYPCLEVAWHKERLYDFSKGCVTLGHKGAGAFHSASQSKEG